VVARVEFQLSRRTPDEIKRTIAELNARRKATQPTNTRTFGSVFKNPAAHQLGAGRMLDECGLKDYRIGGARISPRHANFIENVDGARAVDALALMAEGRRRVLAEFGVVLEREVELIGGLELPSAGDAL
jgi:UDP-N-acetylmuramate dehydrogenase